MLAIKSSVLCINASWSNKEERKNTKYIKKARKFYEISGKFAKMGAKYNFPEIGENVVKQRKIGGNSKFVVND